jgi:type 1 fimbriae regulatory protein FimB/type 1 fimbriae regulatory protein FimE
MSMVSAPFSAKSPPAKPRNADRRAREYLVPSEVEALMRTARGIGRYGQRDATLILMMYRHALRVSEVSRLRWELIDLKMALLHVRRLKSGVPSVHPLHGPELRALRRLKTQYPGMAYVFVSQRGSPLTARAIRHIVLRAGKAAHLPFPVHPHMLRHACGFYLANRGADTRSIQHYLGHRNIQHTVRYTELTPQRFSEFWED